VAADERKAEPQLRVPCLTAVDEPAIRDHLAHDRFFWLDLASPAREEILRLRELFGFHPLAIEDTLHFDQRPKLDEYGDHVFLVFYGAVERELREVHLYISGAYLVTVHAGPLPALEVERHRVDEQALASEQFLLYRVLDALTDSFFPVLASIDDEIDDLEEAIVSNPTEECLRRLFGVRRELVALRKVITPQRDIFARSIDHISSLPGLTVDERDYFRDVYDHLIRMSDLVDSYRDLLSGAIDLYLSTVGNRQNEVMKQLAIVGTIFLPLSFITGFFGQNFGWLVAHALTGLWSFLAFGIGSIVVTCIALLLFFRRRGWL
jgi:magnesium transporter